MAKKFVTVLLERKKGIVAVRKAIKWMKDAEILLDETGFGFPDACDSAMLATVELMNIGVMPGKIRKCITLLTKTVEDVLPQIGGIVLQDYAALNDGLILSRDLIGDIQKKDKKK